MKPNTQTRLVGVIGWPIEHSLSPAMQNAALREMGLNWLYLAFAVEPERVGEALAGVRGLGLVGLNVTIPHKSAVIEHLDGLGESARIIGAVNTDAAIVAYADQPRRCRRWAWRIPSCGARMVRWQGITPMARASCALWRSTATAWQAARSR